MATLPNMSYKFNTIPTKIPAAFFAAADKVILTVTSRFKVLTPAAARMHLKNMLSGKQPVTKISYCRTPYI